LDAHGPDPDQFVWIPVLRKRRHDGWTPEKQREFVEALADSGSVVGAARAVGLSEQNAYALRRSSRNIRSAFLPIWKMLRCSINLQRAL
jgi:hypothetical protein